MTRITIRISDEMHEKLRWVSYKERISQQILVENILKKALEDVTLPEEEPK